ncbi:MAG TPA: glycosyltransferase [Herpetosiphonaceae bacterium]
MISKALTAAAYHRKLELIAAEPGVELAAVVPPVWLEPGVGEYRLEVAEGSNYRLHVLPLRHNGRHHTYTWRGLPAVVEAERPDILHIDEEAFNLSTWQALRLGRRLGARMCFYNWANIDRFYPPPFRQFERAAFRHAAHALAGNHEAAEIIKAHGYRGPVTVIPQFGVDEELFLPAEDAPDAAPRPFVVGFFGRLMRSKGIEELLEAMELLPDDLHLRLIGQGELSEQVAARIAAAPLAGRVTLEPLIPSGQVPAAMRELHAYALPSRTTATWKEQFGRVLIEAMASGVPVVGSSSGEIPHVIGEAGLIFPEGDAAALAAALRRLYDDEQLRRSLRAAGRQRVLDTYTQRSVARQYVAVYRSMLEAPAP